MPNLHLPLFINKTPFFKYPWCPCCYQLPYLGPGSWEGACTRAKSPGGTLAAPTPCSYFPCPSLPKACLPPLPLLPSADSKDGRGEGKGDTP